MPISLAARVLRPCLESRNSTLLRKVLTTSTTTNFPPIAYEFLLIFEIIVSIKKLFHYICLLKRQSKVMKQLIQVSLVSNYFMENIFGQNIRAIRESWQISQEEMGVLIKATRGMVMQYEKRGSLPKGETFETLIAITGLSREKLTAKLLKRQELPQIPQQEYEKILRLRTGLINIAEPFENFAYRFNAALNILNKSVEDVLAEMPSYNRHDVYDLISGKSQQADFVEAFAEKYGFNDFWLIYNVGSALKSKEAKKKFGPAAEKLELEEKERAILHFEKVLRDFTKSQSDNKDKTHNEILIELIKETKSVLRSYKKGRDALINAESQITTKEGEKWVDGVDYLPIEYLNKTTQVINTGNGGRAAMIPFLDRLSQMKFVKKLNDNNFLKSLPRHTYTVTEGNSQFFTFEVILAFKMGDSSMDNGSAESIRKDDILLCYQIDPSFLIGNGDLSKEIRVVITEEQLFCCSIEEVMSSETAITCSLFNPNFPAKEIPFEKLKAVFGIFRIEREC
jgi:transcriptional regulator with XRE-family HTH domain